MKSLQPLKGGMSEAAATFTKTAHMAAAELQVGCVAWHKLSLHRNNASKMFTVIFIC
jgi:hypothetical protein